MRQARAFAPRLDEQRHQLPLRAARVLEFVDEHVVIARLEAVAALRKLLHPAQQIERAQQQIGEIEHGVRVERAPVLGLGDAEHPSDPTRHQHVEIAPVGSRHPRRRRRRGRRRGPGGVRQSASEANAVFRVRTTGRARHRPESGSARACAKTPPGAVPASRAACASSAARSCRRPRASSTNAGSSGPDSRNRSSAAAHRIEHGAERCRRPPRRQPRYRGRLRPMRRGTRRGRPAPRSGGSSSVVRPIRARRSPSCANDQRHVLVVAGERPADAQRAVERLVDQARAPRCRRRSKRPGSRSASSGNSRSSDRQNASIVLMAMSAVRSRSSRQRAGGISPARRGGAQRGHDALAHFRGRLARERDRQDVRRDRRPRAAG